MLYTYDDYHNTTIQCLVARNPCPYLHQAAETEEDSFLKLSLQPIQDLCELVAAHTERIECDGILSNSYSANLCSLLEAIVLEVNNIADKYPERLEESILVELVMYSQQR